MTSTDNVKNLKPLDNIQDDVLEENVNSDVKEDNVLDVEMLPKTLLLKKVTKKTVKTPLKFSVKYKLIIHMPRGGCARL
jgi:hypothetical protein